MTFLFVENELNGVMHEIEAENKREALKKFNEKFNKNYKLINRQSPNRKYYLA